MRIRLAALVVAASTALPAQAPPPQAPSFRSSSTLVPVDVRVVDADGHPVTGLTRTDFVVKENGQSQDIASFAPHTFTAEAPVTGAAGTAVFRRLDDPDVADTTPQNQRIFLFVLGRGRLQPPARGIDAVADFVKGQLLPQDAVAVMAWNRATDFTVEHARITDVVERFRTRHEKIDLDLREWFSGLRALYGRPEIPAHIQRQIDEVFVSHGGAATRDLPPMPLTNEGRVNDDLKRLLDDAIRRNGMAGLDAFVAATTPTLADVRNLYTAIEYMRNIAGEKHLVFVTEDGFSMPSGDDDEAIAAMANDARVTIDTIHTGGVSGAPGMDQMFRVGSLKSLAALTGGQSSAFTYASNATRRIDEASRATYLLGYYPRSTAADGRYRKITVEVKKPGVTAHYRHGYFSRDSFAPLDRRQALSMARITAAGSVGRAIKDLRIALTAQPFNDNGARGIAARIQVSPDRVQFKVIDGKHVGVLHVAVFCGNARSAVLGQAWRQVELSFPDDLYRQFMARGMNIDLRVPTTAGITMVKAVVYDPNADLLGSTTIRLPTAPRDIR